MDDTIAVADTAPAVTPDEQVGDLNGALIRPAVAKTHDRARDPSWTWPSGSRRSPFPLEVVEHGLDAAACGRPLRGVPAFKQGDHRERACGYAGELLAC